MTGEDVGRVFEATLPKENIERQWKLNLLMLVRTVVISTGMPVAAYQEDIPRVSLEFEVPRVARSTLYRWFDEPLDQSMATLSQLSPAYAWSQQVDLPNLPACVTDRCIVDSTTVKLQDALLTDFSESGSYVKVHTILSGGCGVLVLYHFIPVREHGCQ